MIYRLHGRLNDAPKGRTDSICSAELKLDLTTN